MCDGNVIKYAAVIDIDYIILYSIIVKRYNAKAAFTM